MWEFTIVNIKTKEERMIFGTLYSLAMERAGLNKEEWKCVMSEYID